MKACAHCGASLADDQRYCLECGARQVQARSQFLSRFTPAAAGHEGVGGAGAGGFPGAGGAGGGAAGGSGRFSGVTAIAGVGVLLLAMGVGVLIGRAAAPKATTAPPQVISVGTPAGSSGAGNPTATTPAEGTPSGAPGNSSETGGGGSGGGSSSSSSSSKSSSPNSSSKSGAKGSSESSGGGAKNGNGGGGSGGGSSGGGSKTKSNPSTEEAEKKTRNIPNVVTTG